MMRFQQRTETRSRSGFTIDFKCYKVLIIRLISLMFMADLCYIFIYQMWLMSLMFMADLCYIFIYQMWLMSLMFMADLC